MNQHRLRVTFCDHLNLARSKYINYEGEKDGEARYCQGLFGLTYQKGLYPSSGSTLTTGLPDCIGKYKGEDIRDSWNANEKIVLADLYDSEHRPLQLCGRSLLKRTVSEWAELGYQPKLGIELEAYAFTKNTEGDWVPYDTPGSYVYSGGPFADPLGILDDIWQASYDLGFPLETMVTEFDSPQFEFTLRYDDALKAVDDIFLFRLMVREIAIKKGVLLSFMGKPIAEAGGSGVHYNMSFNNKAGKNITGSDTADDLLSEIGRGCVKGMMHHHKGLAALLAPTVNSYERLKPASLSGYWKNWGIDHRGVTVRVANEKGPKARVEHRMADGGSNPYVAAASVLQASLLGVKNDYPLDGPETLDCFEDQDAKTGVAENLQAALEDLESDTALVSAIGELLVSNHVGIKKAEIEEVEKLNEKQVRDYYLNFI